MTRSQEFIQKNKKKLTAGAAFYNPDTSLMPIEKYESSKLKMILIFPSPFTVKTVSSTASAINDFFIEHCPDVFLDFAYMPEGEDIKLYNDNLMPYAIGNITHLDASYFDVVGFSISVLSEIVTAPVMLKSFERCDKPIELFWSDRKTKSIKDHPIIYAGGITAVCGDVMFGKVGDKESYLDFEYLGSVDKTDVLLRRLIEAKETGYVIRYQEDHDIPGYLHKDSVNFESKLKVDTVQDYIESLFDLSMIYQPQAYEVKYNKYHRIISNIKTNPKAQDFVTPFYPHVLAEELGIGRTIIPGNGDNCGVSQVQVSEGCSSGGACSFCAEGNYCGGHVEKTRDEILRESLESKKYSAAYKFKPFSFNVNYVTDYKGLLYDWIQMYPKVTFINMRMEELGRDTDALHMMKLVGSNRISAPMEGLSPRIQNNLLNKCLSAESLNNFMDDMVHAKMTDIKCGGIFTAYEEDQDFQWICDFVDKFKKRAALEGGNFPFRLKCTPLVHYSLTPIEYIERKSALKSFEGEHWLTDEWYEKFREHQVFFKVNGFRYSTFLEQSLVDMGRFLTPIIHEFFVNTLAPIYSLRSIATDEFLSFLKKQVNPFIGMTNLIDEQKEEEKKYMFGWFGDRHPEHYISPNHRVHIELMGSYIPRARRLVEAKQNGDIFSNEPDIRCLKTFEGAKVRCYSSCIKDNPLKIYNDVVLDENGVLHGEYRNLNGCERCQTPAQKRWRLTRPTPQSKNSDDIIAAPRIPQVQKLRFVLNRSREYDVLNPNNTAHTFITKFLQLSDNLLHSYHSVNVHNMFWQCDPGIDYFCAGFQIVDTFWSKDVLTEVRSLIPEVNKMLKSIQVVSVKEELKDEKIKVDDFNIFYFESEIQSPYFESATHNYDGEIKVVTGQMGEVSTIQDKILKAPIFSTKAGKTVGCFAIPAKYNPAMFLSSFLSNVKKSSLHQVNELTQFTCLSTVRETQSVCKHCGQEHSLVSIATGTQLPFGLQCLCKVLLSKKLK